jgi:hypothetical protein
MSAHDARCRTLGATLVAFALLACGPRDPGAEARADSAAAGYDVGPAPASPATPAVVRDSAQAPAPDGPGSRPLIRPVPPTPPPRLGVRSGDSASSAPRTDASTTGPLANPRVTHPGGTPSAVPVPTPPDTTPAPVGRVRLSEQLEFDAAERTVWLNLVHARNDANDGLNIDGRSKGALTITVPLGWRVEATTTNRDDQRPHSAMVIEGEPSPGEPLTPAFADARTQRAGGIVQGERGAFAFTAERAGRYAIACGVAGHAEGGEWITLLVEPATRPAQR